MKNTHENYLSQWYFAASRSETTAETALIDHFIEKYVSPTQTHTYMFFCFCFFRFIQSRQL